MKTINIETTQSHKLRAKAFTEIKLHNPQEYKKGQKYTLHVNGVPTGRVVELVDYKIISVTEIDNYVSQLTMGLPVEECQAALFAKYHRKSMNWTQQFLAHLLFVYTEHVVEASAPLFGEEAQNA